MQNSISSRWIVSRNFDLFFFIGSCVFTFIFFGIYNIAHYFNFVLNGDKILITYLFFTAILDHPHIFQTFSRTHLDTEEFQRRKTLHTWGIALFIAVGFVIAFLGYDSELIVAASIFGSYHIIRQHYGFLSAYKGINQDRQKIDNHLDYGVFYSGMFACFTNDYTDIGGIITIYKDLKANFPEIPSLISEVLWAVFMVYLALFIARQVWLLLVGEKINLPKILLLTAALGTHYFIFFATATPFLVAEALETAYHDVQYQGWMMNYQQRRFPHIKRVVLKWLLVSLLYGLVVGLIEVYSLWYQNWLLYLFVPFTMLVIYHYYVDGLIWKFGKDEKLRQVVFQAKKI